ncbi:hypothetical protein GCM10023225_16000 [Kineococcus glutinatus]|uniref:Uncharacterized protein n=1 Tax=Kineococcus glutinatus TaxID=1070872 RepID=A0ABP9HQ95_9ACTN
MLALLVTASLCAACTGGPATPEAAGSRVDGPVIVVTGTSTADSDASAASGPLSLTDGCLLLGDLAVLVWEEGTSWDSTPPGRETSGGRAVLVGHGPLGS